MPAFSSNSTTWTPTFTNSTFPTYTNTTENQILTKVEDTVKSFLDNIPLPRWLTVVLMVVGAILILIIVLCLFLKCCRKSKKKEKKKDKIGLKGVNGGSTTALRRFWKSINPLRLFRARRRKKNKVQPEVTDLDYGSSKEFRGKLLYSLDYSVPQSELTVGIKEADSLKAMDLGGSSDPYVKVYMCPDKNKTCETKVLKNTLKPVFNESFTFQVSKAALLKSTVVMQVYDFNRFSKHNIIGEVRLQLENFDWNHVMEEWQDLSEPSRHEEENRGDICFSLRYVPTSNKLTVVILEAKNLKVMDLGGSSDPYVKVQLTLDKRKWKKRKTSVKKRTLAPYYNESFTFSVTFEQIQRVNLVIAVWDYDTVTRNDAIGKIYLGCEASGNQLRHWADMLSNPRRPVAQWHSLLSAQQVDSALNLKRKLPKAPKLPFNGHR